MKYLSAFAAIFFATHFMTLPVNASDDNLRAPLIGTGPSTTVPAPSTLLLMAVAAGLLALKRKKRWTQLSRRRLCLRHPAMQAGGDSE